MEFYKDYCTDPKFHNSDINKYLHRIIRIMKEDIDVYENPTKGEYDNGYDPECGEDLVGYAIDVDFADEAFLYGSELERDEDYILLTQLLDLIYQEITEQQQPH